MIGKDLTTLEALLDQLEVLRSQELVKDGGNSNEFGK
jgi:hypothetical protein